MSDDRRVLVAGLASLTGAVVGAVVGGTAGGFLWFALTGPHEGLEALGAVVAGMLAGAIASYPGALVGVWLAVRGRPRDRRTLALVALAYPLVATGLSF